LEGSWLAESEDDGVSGQLGIGVGHGVKAGSDCYLVKWVEEDGLGALSVDGNTDSAAGDAAW
jgi:hypothetical protein